MNDHTPSENAVPAKQFGPPELSLAHPGRFMRMVEPFVTPIWVATVICLCAGLYFALWASPPDYQQGQVVRIMYIHVPSAWIALYGYLVMALASAGFLIWRHPLADLIARASAPIGMVFGAICLVTGALWGKPIWGTWWVWDARLTSMLVLFLLYLGYIGLGNAFEQASNARIPCACLALIGAINVPIIKFSVDWWNTLHQPSSLFRTEGPAISDSMLIPLSLMIIAGFLLYSSLLIMRIKLELARTKLQALLRRRSNEDCLP
ncbi:MAG: heme ABC transporter permease [Pseudomonadota bacterium]